MKIVKSPWQQQSFVVRSWNSSVALSNSAVWLQLVEALKTIDLDTDNLPSQPWRRTKTVSQKDENDAYDSWFIVHLHFNSYLSESVISVLLGHYPVSQIGIKG